MTVELIGLFAHRAQSESLASPAAEFDSDFMKRLTRDYEDAGYDRMLIATSASWADSLSIASYLAGVTRSLKFLIAHRPGIVAPTAAARMLATIDQLSGGRVGVHIISGASDTELQSDGDFEVKARRYQRSAEYADILRGIWTSPEPIDHDGSFYRFNRGFSRVRPIQQPAIPIFWGGASGDALAMAARAADIYAFGIEPLERTQALIEQFRGHCKTAGRSVGLCVSAKIIVGETQEDAWANAREIRSRMTASGVGESGLGANARRVEMMDMADIQDKCLWLGLNKAKGGAGHFVSLVGSGEQIADALLDYYDLGVRSFLFHGYDIANDPKRFGQALIPCLRDGIARREALAA
jgi:alkanesulfonate monooxygenase